MQSTASFATPPPMDPPLIQATRTNATSTAAMASIASIAGPQTREQLLAPGIRINAMSGREPQALGTCTTIVGIGGAGGNLLNHMIRSGVDGACNHLYINCHLNERADPVLARHQLNIAYRCDMSSDEIRTTCLSRKDEVLSYFMGAKAVVLLTGLGGGFGSSVTPIIARFARELGICVTAVVTTPFEWEGRRNAVAKMPCLPLARAPT